MWRICCWRGLRFRRQLDAADGSIGSELCRQVSLFHPQRLLLLEQSEVQMFLIEQELWPHLIYRQRWQRYA